MGLPAIQAVDDHFTTDYDTPLDLGLDYFDNDVAEAQWVGLHLNNAGTHGTWTMSQAAIRYTPDPGFVGEATIEYRVQDNKGQSSAATIHVMVAAPAPVDLTDVTETIRYTTRSVTLDPVVDVPAGSTGTIHDEYPYADWTVNPDLSVTFTNIDYLSLVGGILDAQYTVTSPQGISKTVTLTVLMNGPQLRAVDDSATIRQNTPVTVDVLANDQDAAFLHAELVSVQGQGPGSWEIVDGQIRFTPDAGFTGLAVAEYTVQADQHPGIETSTARIAVRVTAMPVKVRMKFVTRTEGRKHVRFYTLAPNVDSDGDGLTNAQEQRPYRVTVRARDGHVVERWTVSSDPLSKDTDRDGLSDRVERRRTHTDPWDRNTDSHRGGVIDGKDRFPLIRDKA